MSNQILKMMYHPAKKKVKFKLTISQKEIEIPDSSVLFKYMNKRDGFVLQDQGNEFLDDIAKVFDGFKEADIDVVTTKNDYDDFAEMVEFYNNENPVVKINISHSAFLPDMNDAYKYVSEYGQKSKTILSDYLEELENIQIPDNMGNVKEAVKNLYDVAKKKLNGIDSKVSAVTSDDNVRLCFAGVYSAGKSSLINAILGYPILPEAINPETAKMFSIQSPDDGDPIRIECTINDKRVNIFESEDHLDIDAELIENETRAKLLAILNDRGTALHIQMNKVLDCLNKAKDVSSKISIFFPVPLDDDTVHFTIFDTPGTDAGNEEHQYVLMDALSSQTHSILIFVALGDALQGSGNRSLMEYLKSAESKSSTSIDIGRSLFVINKADALDEESREKLRHDKLVLKKTNDSDDETFEIDLSNKKLFFTSAKYANAAAAVTNGYATDKQKKYLSNNMNNILDEDTGLFFMQNQCAQSQYGTNRMRNESQTLLDKAKQNSDNAEVFHIGSGLYALEKEIINYGKKFAAAVKTFAVINNVEDAFTTINNPATSLDKNSREDIEKIEEDIRTAKSLMTEAISKAYEKYFPDPGNDGLVTESDKLSLRISSEYLKEDVADPARSKIEKILKRRIDWGDGFINVHNKDRMRITDALKDVLENFQAGFVKNRKRLLENKRDGFIESVKEAFRSNGGLNSDVLDLLLDITPPQINPAELSREKIDSISNDLIVKSRFFKIPQISKEKFINKAVTEIMFSSQGVIDDMKKDYLAEGNRISDAISAEYNDHLETYSTLLHGLIENKEKMQEIGGRIHNVADKIDACTNELESIIWKEENSEDN